MAADANETTEVKVPFRFSVSLLRTYLKPHRVKMSLNAGREYTNWQVNTMKEKRGENKLCVSNQGFQRNSFEPVCRTSMTFTPSRLSFFPGERITRPGCIVW